MVADDIKAIPWGIMDIAYSFLCHLMPISQAVYELIIENIVNTDFALFGIWLSNQVSILHLWPQQSCRGIWKISTWYEYDFSW